MPLLDETVETKEIGLDEFIASFEEEVDLYDDESILAASHLLKKLANNKHLVSGYINKQIDSYVNGHGMQANGPQSLMLGSGRGFLVRANIWIPAKVTGVFRSYEERLYSYGVAHDHNFTFSTVGYFGPGYTTDLFEYSREGVAGFVGEKVELKYSGTEALTPGKVMVFREGVDVHVQHPPSSLSISINVLIPAREQKDQDQYFFDLESSAITGMPEFALSHQRATIVGLAGFLANSNTISTLIDLVESSPCKRIREAALNAIARTENISNADRLRVYTRAAGDEDAIVREKARGLLVSA